MCHLQELHRQYQGKGVAILGFNPSDDKKIALEFLAENGATFPTILDSSAKAERVAFREYGISGVPVNYVIDRQGKVVDAWYGYEEGHARAKAALKKAGFNVPQSTSGATMMRAISWAKAALKTAGIEVPQSLSDSMTRTVSGAEVALKKARIEAPPAAPSAERKPLGTGLGSVWGIALSLDAPGLQPPAVQWAILDHDPLPGFKAHVQKLRSLYRRQLERVGGPPRDVIRSVEMRNAWDSGFKEITGDQLSLLTSAPGVPGSHNFSANTPDGRKWIVTKTVQIKGKPVCWCVPVEVKKGERVKVSLTDGNRFDVGAAFDDAMREPEPGK
jgi:hypothetical protein